MKKIRLTQNEIRRMISEAIKSHSFNGEGFNVKPDSDYDSFGNPKYPEGVFSTDDPKAAKKIRDDFDSYDAYYGESPEARNNKEKLANLIDKRANDEDAELDRRNYGRYEMEDEYGDEEKESQRYDKPFDDDDEIENQYGYEDDDDDEYESIAGINEGRRQIRLSEQKLREFVSYSVSRLLREALEEKEKKNLAVTFHSNGEKHEKSDEDRENDEHMFHDWYWKKKEEERNKKNNSK